MVRRQHRAQTMLLVRRQGPPPKDGQQSMTQRFMHRDRTSLEAAIRLARPSAGRTEALRGLQSFGDLEETRPPD